MSRSIVTIAGGVLLLGASAARPAHAMDDADVVKAHVPFAFHVLDTSLPAGDYTLRQVDVNTPSLIEIRSVKLGGPAAVFLANARDSGDTNEPQLIFDKVGKQRFLRAVLLPEQTGVALPEARSEVEAARQLAVRVKPTHKSS